MKQVIWILSLTLIVSCKQEQESNEKVKPTSDNEELAAIYVADQSDRQSDEINWAEVSSRDSLRRQRVIELLDSNKVRTYKDYQNAAMVFQHGNDSTDYGQAVKLMKKSIALNPNGNKWLLAAATDRYLLSKGKPQIYGTQYHKMGDEPWELSEIDTTKITDEERIEFGVETLQQQREKLKQMNQKQLSEFLNEGNSVDELLVLIKNQDQAISEFNTSESALNRLGYQLMSEEKNQEALKVFKLNTTLYPEEYNTYDSYGECLLKMGDKENAIIAYEKSLQLNPNNENAKEVLAKLN